MEPHEWYDRIAKLYRATRGDKMRRQLAVELLQLRLGDVVLVPGCGTGFDLPYLMPAVGPEGRVIGLDYSKEMLRRAESLVHRHEWTNVTLIHADAQELSADFLHAHTGVSEVDGLLFANVLSIFPNWTDVFARGFDLLRLGGRCVVVDIKPSSGAGRISNPLVAVWKRLGAADIRRRVLEPLEARAGAVDITCWRHFFVAGATKQESAHEAPATSGAVEDGLE